MRNNIDKYQKISDICQSFGSALVKMLIINIKINSV